MAACSRDEILPNDLLPFDLMHENFKSIYDHNGSFQAISFITEQLEKSEGHIEYYRMKKDLNHSKVVINHDTETAFLFLMAYRLGKFIIYIFVIFQFTILRIFFFCNIF